MLMVVGLLTIAALIVALKFVPVRSVVLIEGVFNRERDNSDLFSGKKFKVYYFDYACRECWETNRHACDECHAAIPKLALKLELKVIKRRLNE